MRPAEKLAALKAFAKVLEEAIGEEEAKVRELMDDSGADRFATPFGKVSLATRSTKIVFDEDQLLIFAEDADLDGVEVIRQVRPTFKKLFEADAEQVIFTPTGEVVDFARPVPGTQYLTTRLTDGARDRALQVLGATVNVLTEGDPDADRA